MGQFYKRSNIKQKKFYGPPNWIKAKFAGIKAEEIPVQSGDRLDIIAESRYGNPDYWKAIAAFNGIEYFFELKDGDIILLPYRIEDVLERM